MIEPQPKRHSPLIWLVFLVIVIDLVGFGLVIPLLPFMAPALGWDSSDIAFIMITYAIGAALIAPLWGRFSDRAGRRQALVLALVCLLVQETRIHASSIGLWCHEHLQHQCEPA